jgi:hypothetical protein
MTLMTPEQIVDAQIDAYNARDVDRFLTFYTDDAVIRDGDGTLLRDGKSEIREYSKLFDQNPGLRCTRTHRIVAGKYITDGEYITGRREGNIEAVVMYHVNGQKIDHATIGKKITERE